MLSRFVPCNLQRRFNLRETARDRLLVHIPLEYDRLSVWQGFLFEQEPVFTDKSSSLLDNPEIYLCDLAYKESLFRVCVAFFLALCSEYRMRYVPTDTIAFAGKLGFAMEVALGSGVNVREMLKLLDVIEETEFATNTEKWHDL